MVDSIGRIPIGRKQAQGMQRKALIRKMRNRIENITDKSRMKLLEARRRYEIKVRQNEEKMLLRREGRERNLNPTAVELIPSRKYAKLLRNPVNWSAVPAKPRYSGSQTSRVRIYGKRFDLLEKGTAAIPARPKQLEHAKPKEVLGSALNLEQNQVPEEYKKIFLKAKEEV